MNRFLYFLSAVIITACSSEKSIIPDIGRGFEIQALYAPWDNLTNDTRFCCHSTAERFFFSFEVSDSTLILKEPFIAETDVNPEDRVEIFFSADNTMKEYYCAEIDPLGRVMDYKAAFYRKFDYDWNFSSLETYATKTPWGYRVGGNILLSELKHLGMNLENGFCFGIFQADYKDGKNVNWYSYIPTESETPDFHKPDVLFKCKITPEQERHGVVVYPSDIISVGLEEWEKRIIEGGINLIGIHAATNNEPLDTLEMYVKSPSGQAFLKLCDSMNVDVEYEIHALQFILPRELFDSHPEYFREDTTGIRRKDYNMCFSSKEAIEAMRPQIRELLKWMKPTTHRYYFWTDDKQGCFCNCAKCSKYSPSEQALIYENELLGIIRDYDHEATLAHLAYHNTLSAPLKVRAAEGIFLEFAPINRDYSQSLTDDDCLNLRDNLLAFPGYSQHILEYWLDESMFSRWKPTELVKLPFKTEECSRDISLYRSLGAIDITTFATWLNADYIRKYGSTDDIFRNYGTAF